ncbi:MAG: M48 family metallopeptidase [Burkholderiales bacterium]|nr:M48 family metallopeptidase [Burkholderiales bacterium]
MNRILACFLAALSVCSGPYALAKDAEPQEGIKVGKVSPLAKLVPQQKIESQALQQYEGLKTQAKNRGVLVPDNDPEVARLRRIAQKLIPHTKRWSERASAWQWEVNLIASNQVNAFCMPGGKIAFFSGILKTLKLTDDEVAIVMGHEMAHALREHGRERMAKGLGLQALVLAGSAYFKLNDGGRHLAGKGAELVMLKFSRGDETEADLAGLDIAARAGFDPRAGIALWQKMGIINKHAPPQWLSTHPAGENRIAEMRKHLPDVMPLFAKTKGAEVQQLGPYKSNVSVLAPIQ